MHFPQGNAFTPARSTSYVWVITPACFLHRPQYISLMGHLQIVLWANESRWHSRVCRPNFTSSNSPVLRKACSLFLKKKKASPNGYDVWWYIVCDWVHGHRLRLTQIPKWVDLASNVAETFTEHLRLCWRSPSPWRLAGVPLLYLHGTSDCSKSWGRPIAGFRSGFYISQKSRARRVRSSMLKIQSHQPYLYRLNWATIDQICWFIDLFFFQKSHTLVA